MYYSEHQAEALEKLVMKKRAAMEISLPPPYERRLLRTQLGLTQADVADVLFIHPDTFGRWERGDARPGPNSLRGYAKLLQTFVTLHDKYGSTSSSPVPHLAAV